MEVSEAMDVLAVRRTNRVPEFAIQQTLVMNWILQVKPQLHEAKEQLEAQI
jgi:hypothetical protein